MWKTVDLYSGLCSQAFTDFSLKHITACGTSLNYKWIKKINKRAGKGRCACVSGGVLVSLVNCCRLPGKERDVDLPVQEATDQHIQADQMMNLPRWPQALCVWRTGDKPHPDPYGLGSVAAVHRLFSSARKTSKVMKNVEKTNLQFARPRVKGCCYWIWKKKYLCFKRRVAFTSLTLHSP